MRYDEIHKAVVDYFMAVWVTPELAPYSAYKISNTAFTEPDAEWVGLGVEFPDSKQTAVGLRITRVMGIVAVDIYNPKGQGDRKAHRLAAKLAAIFNVVRINTVQGISINTDTCKVSQPFPRTDGFIQRRATCTFVADVVPVAGESLQGIITGTELVTLTAPPFN